MWFVSDFILESVLTEIEEETVYMHTYSIFECSYLMCVYVCMSKCTSVVPVHTAAA